MAVTLQSRGIVGAVCLLLSFAITGCGFQLRGSSSVPEAIQPLALKCTSPVPNRICEAVSVQLSLGQVATSSPDNATAILEVTDFQQQRRANAVTSRAIAAEYTIRESVNVQVVSSKQVPLIAREKITTAETYRYDETNVLAKQREEDALQKQLAERLAQQILFRLAPLNQTRLDSLQGVQ